MEPTLITKTHRDMSIVRDEIFGPVLCATTFSDRDDIERIAQLANDTDYGLAARIWTRDIGLAHGLARRINAGSVERQFTRPGWRTAIRRLQTVRAWARRRQGRSGGVHRNQGRLDQLLKQRALTLGNQAAMIRPRAR